MNTRTPLLLALCTLALAACSTVGPASDPPNAPPPSPPGGDRGQVMCTQDAMQCPDGRWVGRQPPGCQFNCAAPAAR